MGSTTLAESATVMRLINSREGALKVQLEPWGEEYEMPPGAIFQVVARGPEGDGLEVAFADEQITVWGWPGAVVTLFWDGTELGAGAWPRSPVPPMPPLEGTPATPVALDTSAR